MKNVMVRAWEIAKEGQVKFGGSVRQYFAEALRMAWKEAKQPSTTRFVLKNTRGFKSWIARIGGKDARYGLQREFLDVAEYDEDGNKVFYLVDGIYEFTQGKREFIAIENGEMTYTSNKQVFALVG